MDQKDEVPAAPPADEPYLGTVDIILLVVLLAGAAWYLWKKISHKEVQPERTYSIQ